MLISQYLESPYFIDNPFCETNLNSIFSEINILESYDGNMKNCKSNSVFLV